MSKQFSTLLPGEDGFQTELCYVFISVHDLEDLLSTMKQFWLQLYSAYLKAALVYVRIWDFEWLLLALLFILA